MPLCRCQASSRALWSRGVKEHSGWVGRVAVLRCPVSLDVTGAAQRPTARQATLQRLLEHSTPAPYVPRTALALRLLATHKKCCKRAKCARSRHLLPHCRSMFTAGAIAWQAGLLRACVCKPAIVHCALHRTGCRLYSRSPYSSPSPLDGLLARCLHRRHCYTRARSAAFQPRRVCALPLARPPSQPLAARRRGGAAQREPCYEQPHDAQARCWRQRHKRLSHSGAKRGHAEGGWRQRRQAGLRRAQGRRAWNKRQGWF